MAQKLWVNNVIKIYYYYNMDKEYIKKLKKLEEDIQKQINNYSDNVDDIIEDFHVKIRTPDPFPDIEFDIPIEDGLNELKKTILGGIQNTVNDKFITPLNKTIKDSVDTIVNLINTIIGGIETAVNGVFSILNTVVHFINETAARFIEMGKGLNDIFTGLFVTETNALGQGLKLGFNNIGILLKWVGEFLFSYITCGVQYIQNLHRCIFFYGLDAVLHMSYLPVRLFLWQISSLSNNNSVYKLEKMVWDKIYEGDAILYKYLGIHYAHYPKNIRNSCYNCKRMRVDALKNKVQEINYDFGTKMPSLLQKGVIEMQDGSKTFAGAFSPSFKIPSNYKNVIDENSLSAPKISKLNFSADNVIPKLNL